MKKSSHIAFTIYIVLFHSYTTSAQINAFIGYVYSQNRDANLFNNIIKQYNQSHPLLLTPMSSLKSLHGVDMGLRYRVPSVSFEFDWINNFNKVTDNERASDSTQYRNLIYYRSQSLCLGIEFYHEWLGIGASLDWNKVVIRKQKSTETTKEDWLSNSGLTSHIFLNFEIDMNDAMSVSIRPYVQLPLYTNDLFLFETKLNPTVSAGLDPKDFQKKIQNFGIKFLFINGTRSQ